MKHHNPRTGWLIRSLATLHTYTGSNNENEIVDDSMWQQMTLTQMCKR